MTHQLGLYGPSFHFQKRGFSALMIFKEGVASPCSSSPFDSPPNPRGKLPPWNCQSLQLLEEHLPYAPQGHSTRQVALGMHSPVSNMVHSHCPSSSSPYQPYPQSSRKTSAIAISSNQVPRRRGSHPIRRVRTGVGSTTQSTQRCFLKGGAMYLPKHNCSLNYTALPPAPP